MVDADKASKAVDADKLSKGIVYKDGALMDGESVFAAPNKLISLNIGEYTLVTSSSMEHATIIKRFLPTTLDELCSPRWLCQTSELIHPEGYEKILNDQNAGGSIVGYKMLPFFTKNYNVGNMVMSTHFCIVPSIKTKIEGASNKPEYIIPSVFKRKVYVYISGSTGCMIHKGCLLVRYLKFGRNVEEYGNHCLTTLKAHNFTDLYLIMGDAASNADLICETPSIRNYCKVCNSCRNCLMYVKPCRRHQSCKHRLASAYSKGSVLDLDVRFKRKK